MQFEYIRPIPSPVLEREQEPVRTVGRLGDAPELAELVAHARMLVPDDGASLACPVPPSRRLELPRFSGISLADVVLQAPASPPKPIATFGDEREPLPIIAPLGSEPRALLGPGAMTMTLAIVATLAFGVFVVTH